MIPKTRWRSAVSGCESRHGPHWLAEPQLEFRMSAAGLAALCQKIEGVDKAIDKSRRNKDTNLLLT